MHKQQIPSFLLLSPLLILLLFFTCLFGSSCNTTGKIITDKSGTPGKKLSQAEQLQLTALFIDANREKALGNEDKSLGLFAQCVKRDGQYAPAMYEMARILDQQKHYSDALVMAVAAAKLEPGNEWYQLLLAGIYINTRNYTEAAKVLKQLSDKNPQTPDFSFDLVNVYIIAGKYTDAIKVYDDIEKNFGISEEVSLQKEKLYLEIGKGNKAIEEIEKLLKEFPAEIKYMGILAELYLASGNEIKGMSMYQQILSIDPEDPYVHLSLADYYKSQNNNQKSFEELQQAFINPKMEIDAHIRILIQYFNLSENNAELKEQAYLLCKSSIETHPSEPKAWSIYGDFLNRDNRIEEARSAFRKVISLDSNKYAVWATILEIDALLQDNESLQSESARAIEIFPEQADPYLFNGFANIRLKQYDKAVKSLMTGLLYAVDNDIIAKIYSNLGEALYKLKDFDGSFEAYEKALKLDPENTTTINNYSYYLAIQKQNLSRAEELAKKLNNLENNKFSFEDTYAWVLFMQEKYADSKLWLDKALEHGGATNANVLEHYGDVMYKLNEKDKALEYWLKANKAGAESNILLKKIKEKTWYE